MSARDAYSDAARRARKARLLAIALLASGLALILLLLAPDRDPATKAVARTRHEATGPLRAVRASGAAAASALPLAVVTPGSPAGARTVPRSFLGVSTEYWTLPLFERAGTLLDRVLSLFRMPGEGPLILRIGGDSADHTFWALKGRHTPRWVVDLGPRWLHEVGALVARLDARVILDLNLVTDSPLTAAEWAGTAYRELPHGRVAGFEVGNEPDLYARRYWIGAIERPTEAMAVLPKDISPATYARDFAAYSQTLAQVAPDVPLVGPAVANPASDFGWVSTLLRSAHPGLGMVSGHVYPYSACAARRRATYPTIARVLSENASSGIADRLRPAVAVAQRAGLPFRLTEINSVTCGGKPGVSDTFATALWAPDALFELARAGVDGVNVHVRARAVNAAFSLGRHRVRAHPLLYGLMLFNRTLGPGAQLTPVRVSLGSRAARAAHLKVWAVRLRGDALHVLLIDKGSRAIRVDLRLPAAGAATVERLLAPSVRARSGVTLAGQVVGADGRWHGERVAETVRPGPHGYVVTVPRMSAALVGMQLAPGAFRRGSSGRRRGLGHTRSSRRLLRHGSSDRLGRASLRRSAALRERLSASSPRSARQ
jgi:hypothetical protein